MKKILIKSGTVVTNGNSYQADILIVDNKIEAIAPSIEPQDDTEIYDASGCLVTYGLVDVHTHLREPGFSEKETIATATAAAAHGGFTTIFAMPNLFPCPDSVETISIEQSLIDAQAVIDVRPFATITKGRRGNEVVDVESLIPYCAGFSDDGNGVQNQEIMEEAMRQVSKAGSIIVSHCEDEALTNRGYVHAGDYAALNDFRGIPSCSEYMAFQRDLDSLQKCPCRYHMCHMSTAQSVRDLHLAKKMGLPVTGETAPHYLIFTDLDIAENHGRFKMNPPLRGSEDRNMLLQGIIDGTIDVIATDHAPHTESEKNCSLEKATFGIVGLETSFAVCYTHLVNRSGVISIERLIELMCDNPRRIFGLSGSLNVGEKADIAVFDISNQYIIDHNDFLSKGKATPFDGMEVDASCVLTLFNGKIVWKDEKYFKKLSDQQNEQID